MTLLDRGKCPGANGSTLNCEEVSNIHTSHTVNNTQLHAAIEEYPVYV